MFYKVLSRFKKIFRSKKSKKNFLGIKNQFLGLISLKNQLLGLKSQKIIDRRIFVRYFMGKICNSQKIDKKFRRNEVKCCGFRHFLEKCWPKQ